MSDTSNVFQVPPGIATSVFRDKYARKIAGNPGNPGEEETEVYETWEDVITRVIEGNLCIREAESPAYRQRIRELGKRGILTTSGRHLQHGDIHTPEKMGETFTNCSTSMFSFIKFWLLMKGSGVGRCYNSSLCRVNWDYMPDVRVVLDGPDYTTGEQGHPDYQEWIEKKRDAIHMYGTECDHVRWFTVGDSAEGWAKIVEILETAAYQEKHKNKLFIFDFSGVRAEGSPIRGQQNRPASGPVPLMKAILAVSRIKGAGMKPWKQAMFIDHYLAACVAVGGVRRAARIGVKSWKDRDIFDFIDIKRGGFLYTANNSVSVDDEFWEQARSPKPSHARRVFDAVTAASYFDRTGEPAFLNLSRLTWDSTGMETVTAETMFSERGKKLLDIHPRTMDLVADTLRFAKKEKYPFIVNPCGEIVLAVWGGYCVIGDVNLRQCGSQEEAREGVEHMVDFLMRANQLDFLYEAETRRTNRIGVGLIGIFEYMREYLREASPERYESDTSHKSLDNSGEWRSVCRIVLKDLADAARKRAYLNAGERGVEIPHTITTIKPSGTVSKVMGTTEAAHRAPYAYHMRWVQFPKGSPGHLEHEARGYPVKDISEQYAGHVVVGFPTQSLSVASKTVADLTVSEHFAWLRLLEESWLAIRGNQVSYTLKYDPDAVPFEEYRQLLLENMPTVRACSFIPQEDESAYIYLPEERITQEEFEETNKRISDAGGRYDEEAYDKDQLTCAGEVCPMEGNIR